MLIRRFALSAALTAAIAALLLVAAPARAAGAGTLAPAAVAPGGTITINAAGFRPKERIDRWVTRPDSTSSPIFPYVFADESGSATWTYTLPADAPAGQWTMAARGVRSNDRIGLGFEVTRGAPAVAPEVRTSVTPASGTPGDTFSFTASGLKGQEQVDVWLNGPQDQNFPGPYEVFANDQGVATWQWKAPDNAARGEWRMVVLGRKSRTQYVIPFTVR